MLELSGYYVSHTYLVRSLVHYFGESLMVSLLPCSYLLTNLIDTITCRTARAHIWANRERWAYQRTQNAELYLIMGWKLRICMDAHWQDSEDHKNHLVAKKTMGENGREMCRAIHQTVCWIKSGTLSFSSDQLLSPSPQLQTWHCVSSCLNYHRISGFRMQNWRR